MTAWTAKKLKKGLLTLLILNYLASCSIVEKPFKLKEAETEYAESLFLRQNKATQQVMMLLEENITLDEEQQLSDAELQMYEDCHLLNEVAILEMEGRVVSLYFKQQVQRSLKVCDVAITKMESLLRLIDGNIEF